MLKGMKKGRRKERRKRGREGGTRGCPPLHSPSQDYNIQGDTAHRSALDTRRHAVGQRGVRAVVDTLPLPFPSSYPTPPLWWTRLTSAGICIRRVAATGAMAWSRRRREEEVEETREVGKKETLTWQKPVFVLYMA